MAGISRRGFCLGAGAGLALGGAAGWYGSSLFRPRFLGRSRFTGRSREERRAAAMPGPFPGRVIEVRHPAAVTADNVIQPEPVRAMMERGMCGLIGDNDVAEAWRRFFSRDDVIGIKVNPVGRKPKPNESGRVPGAVESISSPAVIVEIVRSLRDYCNVPPANIILFERYADEFRNTGYEDLTRTRPLAGVRWYASSHSYDDTQLLIDGQNGASRDPNVVGYDPDVFVTMGFSNPTSQGSDDRRMRSHLSMIVTRMVNKIITIPCLKDHKSAGVTLALKNMSHGMNNNVARSHLPAAYRRAGGHSRPNQCNTFIPTAVAQQPLIDKATLHICDGLIGVYEGGPGCWNRTWGTWRRQSLFFATDPVALDHVGWDIIDAKRAEMGYAPVGRMGAGIPDMVDYSPQTVALSLATPMTAAAMGLERERNRRNLVESFDRRQPEHVVLAGAIGLGRFEPHLIDHHVIRL
jgi:hypothetical protein